MITWLLCALVAIAGFVAFCYWGTGLILHPPSMSRLDTFPEQFGLRCEKVAFKTRDGLALKGWFIPSPHGDREERTIIMCHGWGDNKGELLKITHFLNREAGFNLLYFDNRSHGESEGQVTTLGYLETIDFDAAVRYLKENKPGCLKRLGVFGFSMGAATAALSLPSHPEVKAVVLESPFTDLRRVVRQWTWNHFKLPYFPVVLVVLLILRLRVGRRVVDECRPIRVIGDIAPRPLLVICAGLDSLMPEADVRRLFEAARQPKTLWIVPEAGHGKCHETSGLEYETRVTRFFNLHL